MDNISEEELYYKESITYFSKFYNSFFNKELPDFASKDAKTQDNIITDLYKHNSKLEDLLRDIMDQDTVDEE